MKIRSIKFIIQAAFLFPVLFCLQVSAQDEEEGLGWPREVEKKGSKVTFYQPQLESYDDNVLEGRMAVSLKSMFGTNPFIIDLNGGMVMKKLIVKQIAMTATITVNIF